ncbi:MAG: DUF4197 domain-containing protein, partial [Candidatus Methylomirabilis sp.]|nr:DUF4197 domain-containing protein [Deltaproteobacteria bacterium]
GSAASLDDGTIAKGLKEALTVGAERATALASKEDGFLGNDLIRIPLPKPLRKVGRALREVGMGARADELETAMNRAAERASGEAKDVLWTAVKGMTLEDARGILQGGDTAATDYFRRKTEEGLRARFRPIVTEKMAEVGVARQYNELTAAYASIPFAPALKDVNLDDYVTGKALDGLYALLALEEKRIREDPAARATDLLKKVFK